MIFDFMLQDAQSMHLCSKAGLLFALLAHILVVLYIQTTAGNFVAHYLQACLKHVASSAVVSCHVTAPVM